jgi:hypothetical protein
VAAADGDRASCGHPNPVWYTDNRLWNEVMGGDPYAEAGGIVCWACFVLRADERFADRPMQVVAWRLVPDFGFPLDG